MKTINLKDYYPYYQQDSYIELPDEIVAAMKPYKTEEQSHRRRMRLHKVYSLDVGGMENNVVFTALSPCELYERKLTLQELYAAIASLPDKQAKRIYGHYFLHMRICDLAKQEGVGESTVRDAITRGLRNLGKILSDPT